MKNPLLLLFCLISFATFSQFSKTHYIPPVSHSDNQEPQEQVMYISSPSITPINFQIKAPIGGTLVSGTVSRDMPYVYTIGFGNDTPFLIDRNDVNSVKTNKGYIVEAEDLVYVTVRVVATTQRNQAGSIVSKGQAALGRQFRIGAFTNVDVSSTSNVHYTFATILATENNTTVSFGDIKTGVSLINNAAVGNTPSAITLNRGECFAIAVQGPNNANKDGLIGASIIATKDIVVNCGSFGGTNSTGNLDLGMDQIVSAERTGTEYIFIKGNGIDLVEKPIIVANENFTDVFINGSATPLTTLSAGQYIGINGSQFSANGNLYVTTSKKAFAYQGIGGSSSPANQNMHFVPPLNCGTPKAINNIPLINTCGTDNNFLGTVCLVTKTGSTLNFIIDSNSYSLATLPTSYIVTGPFAVTGNSIYETYTISGLTGNVSVFSTSDVYLSYFGTSGAATYGGFYSGFTFDPEITYGTLTTTTLGCIPNVNLTVNALSSFDSFQWYQNGIAIPTLPLTPSPTLSTYAPTVPGYYYVEGRISACGALSPPYDSVEIPVSQCPNDTDNDAVNDNVDLDIDGDGIPNCTESLGDLTIDTTNSSAGTINLSTYSNSFTGNVTTAGTGLPVGNFVGNSNSFVTEVPIGKGNSVTYKIDFANPVSVAMHYVTTANVSDLFNPDANFVIKSPQNTTITVLNPTNQLLIDTNYDGVYEGGVTQFSSFEIRFILNGTVPLPANTGTFIFKSHLTTSLSITQINLSDTATNKATFTIKATCLPKDTDGDGIADQNDLDSDNDGILDTTEFVGQAPFPTGTALTIDLNHNGIVDAFETFGVNYPFDTDGDHIPNYLDLDSDNDGIYDLVESGSSATDANNNGIIDGNPVTFGAFGISNSIQTAPNSSILTYTLLDSNANAITNYIDSDADGDGCSDVIEAGFLDPNSDGYLGGIPINTNNNGLVTSGIGYTTPQPNYLIAAPITITTQPVDVDECNLEKATFSIVTNLVDTYQWQVSSDNGLTFTNITNNTIYSGATTNSLLITIIPTSFNNYLYRVFMTKAGNTCGKTSSIAKLTVKPLPIVASPVSLIQCDDDFDGISNFNLNEKNSFISVNYLTETFTFFRTQAGAIANTTNPLDFIANPTVFNSGSATVWVRVTNTQGCFSVAQLNLTVSIPPASLAAYTKTIEECDDFLDLNGLNNANNNDKDGITKFDLTVVVTEISALLTNPANYTIKFYKSAADALAEFDTSGNSLAITAISNYRNISAPNLQKLWVRIENNTNNDCFGYGEYVTLIVNKKPLIKLTDTYQICLNTPTIKAHLTPAILDGTPTSDYTYIWTQDGTVLPDTTATIDFNVPAIYTVKVTNNKGCFEIRTITVTASDIAHLLPPSVIDLVEENSVTINVTGIGTYEYAIDNPNGTYQISNLFENVSIGIHNFYVRDTKLCGTTPAQTVSVIGAPKFFTPNNDGYNDYWNIKGLNTPENANAIIYVFDRFGKFITQVNPNDQGWDGKLNNQSLIADDYWYTVQLENGRTAKGHFSLKR